MTPAAQTRLNGEHGCLALLYRLWPRHGFVPFEMPVHEFPMAARAAGVRKGWLLQHGVSRTHCEIQITKSGAEAIETFRAQPR